MRKEKYIIFNLSASEDLTEKVIKHLNVSKGQIEIKNFLDGEIYLRMLESVRGKKVFIIQSAAKPVNDHLMEIMIFADSLIRSSAKEINLIIPYFGYSRQDRISRGREPITSKLVAKLLETSGINRVITFDIHASQIQGFFDIPNDNIKTTKLLSTELYKRFDLSNAVVLSPDFGSIRRAREVSKFLNIPMAIVDKRREKHNDVEIGNIIGDIKGKDIFIVDDIIDTGNTLRKILKLIKSDVNNVYIAATHGLFSFSKDVYKNYDEYFNSFKELGVSKIIVTNSISQMERKNDILEVIDISKLIAQLIGVIVEDSNKKSFTDFILEWS